MHKPAAKNQSRHLRTSDLRGLVQLATQATMGVTRIVEGVHQSIWTSLGAPGGKVPEQTGGITGLVYRSIDTVTQLLGNSVDSLLVTLQPRLESNTEANPATPQREAVLAVLNGVMGDRLLASNNPFAIPMTLRYRGEVLDWQAPPPMPEATGKVLLLIHGLCMNDLQWHTEHHGQVVDHGATLASTLGYTPVYLRYNSGLHTSQNGRELSALLLELAQHWPLPIEELTVVAHSMGGLLIRSAVHYARQDSLRWPQYLKSIVFLGVPHHGSPLERAGNRLDTILGTTPYTAPFARLGRLRSAGITDLRYGNVLDVDWQGHDRFHSKSDSRLPLSLPEGVACYTIAATTAARRNRLAERLIGDGLVPLHSALGQHHDARRTLIFAQASQKIFFRMNHLALLSSPEVTRQLVHWLTPVNLPVTPGRQGPLIKSQNVIPAKAGIQKFGLSRQSPVRLRLLAQNSAPHAVASHPA